MEILKIAIVIYLLVGAGFCLWAQVSFGNAIHWRKYPAAILLWPIIMLFAGRD